MSGESETNAAKRDEGQTASDARHRQDLLCVLHAENALDLDDGSNARVGLIEERDAGLGLGVEGGHPGEGRRGAVALRRKAESSSDD